MMSDKKEKEKPVPVPLPRQPIEKIPLEHGPVPCRICGSMQDVVWIRTKADGSASIPLCKRHRNEAGLKEKETFLRSDSSLPQSFLNLDRV